MKKNTTYNCEQSFEAVDFSKVDTSIKHYVFVGRKQKKNQIAREIRSLQKQLEYNKVKEIATNIADPKEDTFTKEETLIYNGVFYLYTNLLWMGSRFEELERVASLIKRVADGDSTIFNTLLLAYKHYIRKAHVYVESVKNGDTKTIDNRNIMRNKVNTALDGCDKISISVTSGAIEVVVKKAKSTYPLKGVDLLAFPINLRGLNNNHWLFSVSDAKIDLVGGADFEMVRKAISITIGGFEKLFHNDKVYRELRPLYKYIFDLDIIPHPLKIVDFIFSLLNLPDKDKAKAKDIISDRDR